jgi:hypothetical protein
VEIVKRLLYWNWTIIIKGTKISNFTKNSKITIEGYKNTPKTKVESN